jgi:thiamine biosynthesis lipoprotein
VSPSATASWTGLGTTASVYVTDPVALDDARAAVEDELASIDLACSRFRDDSELSRVNAAAGRPTRIGPLLCEAIAVALRAARLTEGMVDPTIGEALVLAGYDRDFAALAPAVGPVRTARVPGWRAVRLDRMRRLLTMPGGVRLDLGATAKALAADRAAAAAAAACPARGVLVNLGGDIAVAGPAPYGGWTVRVADDHRAAPDAPGQTLTIRSGGLATSSTTVRRWGAGRHHIIDPRTGAPAAACWRTASVAAASCVDANTASTAAIVLGPAAEAWLAERRLPARLVARDGVIAVVGGWPQERQAA